MKIRNARVRTLVAALAVFAPGGLRRLMWRRLLGYDIDPAASIGHSFIDVDHFSAAAGARVASLCVIRHCERVELAEEAHIGALVWVNAVPKSSQDFLKGRPRETALIMHRAAAITTMHFIDACDRIEMFEYSIIGGMWSQVLAHSFEFRTGELIVAPIVIGPYALVGTRAVVLPGTRIGAKTIFAAGSVIPAGTYEPLSLYAGVPAVRKTDLAADAGLFLRTDSMVR